MHSAAVKQSLSCALCSFSAFCLPEAEHVVVKCAHKLKRNELLCLPHTNFENLYVVQRGVLKTVQVDINGREFIRNFHFEGEVIGCDAIYRGRYAFSVVALSDAVVCEIPYVNLLEVLALHPKLQPQVLSLFSQQLDIDFYRTTTTVEQRLCAFFLKMSARLHSAEKQHEFVLPMSRQDIGNYLGMAAETVSRLLARFQQDKMISIHLKKVKLLNVAKLSAIAEGLQ